MIIYARLDADKKREFLDYDVVVRDLGQIPMETVIEVFQRINSTSYSLKAIEVANARYDNQLKDLADNLSTDPIWDENKVFSSNDIKRMQDTRFALGQILTMMSDYFNRDDQFEAFLVRYNDEFPEYDRVASEIEASVGLLRDCGFEPESQIWKKADLFTALVELHRYLFNPQEARREACARET